MEITLFFKVFKNKILSNLIFKWIKQIHEEKDVDAYSYSQCKIEFMCKNRYFELLKYKLKRNHVQFREKDVIHLMKYNKETELFKELFFKYPSYFLPISEKQQLLEYACLLGNVEIAKMLDNHGTFDKMDCLYSACKSNNIEMVRFVLTFPDSTIFHLKNNFPMNQAVGNIEILKLIYEEKQKHNPDSILYSRDIATLAAVGGHLESLKFIIKFFKHSPAPYTYSIDEVAAKGHFEVLEYFEKNFIYHYSANILNLAVESGNIEIVKRILLREDLIYTEDSIFKAITKGNLEILTLLLKSEAIIIKSHQKCLEFAFNSDHAHIIKYLIQEFNGKNISFPSLFISKLVRENNYQMIQLLSEIMKETVLEYVSIDLTYANINTIRCLLLIHSKSPQIDVSNKFIHCFHVLKRALTAGDQDVIEMLLNIPRVIQTLSSSLSDGINFMNMACKYGTLSTVKWAHKEKGNFSLPINKECFSKAIENENYSSSEILRYLIDNVNISPGENFFKYLCSWVSYKSDFLGIIKYLLSKYPIQTEFTFLSTRDLKSLIIDETPNFTVLKILIEYNYTNLDEIQSYLHKQFQPKFERWKESQILPMLKKQNNK